MAQQITLKQVPIVKQRILERRQNFQCPLCLTPLTVSSGCLDHDHFTGIVRGVLCRNCNGIEGKIKNLVVRGRRGAPLPEYLQRIVAYWEMHSTDKTGLIYYSHLEPEVKAARYKALVKKRRIAKKAGTNVRAVNRRSAKA